MTGRGGTSQGRKQTGQDNNSSNGRVPPNNLEAEESLLGAMLLAAGAITAAQPHVSADDFYRPIHGHIYDAILELRARGESADPVTVANQLDKTGLLDAGGGLADLLSLQIKTPATSNAARYARIVHEHANYRRLIGLAAELAQAGYTLDDDHIATVLDELAQAGHDPRGDTSRYLNGADWIRDTPAGIPAVWGTEDEILWAQGEPLLVVGPTGAGKTTLIQQVVLARLGIVDQVLGYPVQPSDDPVLYLACDRPAQIRRSFRRAIPPEHAHLLDQLCIWEGPPAQDLAKHPRALIDMANTVGARTVIIDSLKDVAGKLSEDETGAGLNRAMQNALVENVEICALHHQRKGQGGVKPKTIEDIYGSVWIPAGCGSVILLWGKAGDLTIELSHLKQPGSPVGPLELVHDHDTANTTIARGPIDALHILRNAPHGITSNDLAQRGTADGPPSRNDIRRAKRTLDKFVRDGQAHIDKGTVDGEGRRSADRYYTVDQTHEEEF